MCLGSPKVPQTPAAPPPSPTVLDVKDDVSVKDARADERKRQRLAAGLQSTFLTGGSGIGSASTARKTLLGQ